MQIFIGRCLTLVLLAASAQAQIRLPVLPLSLPTQPLQSATQSLGQIESRTLDRLSDVRHVEITRLVRSNRDKLDTDGNGDPIVRSEVLALAPTEIALAHALSIGFVVVREQSIDAVGIHLAVLGAPHGMSTKKALRTLREADAEGQYDYNHIYLGSGTITAAGGAMQDGNVTPDRNANTPSQAIPPGAQTHPSTAARIRMGLIDSGIDTGHPVFADSVIHRWGCGDHAVPAAHGTAVASLMIGRDAAFKGVQPNADLFAADVYCGQATGGALDTLVAALGWMVEQQVAVINVSLVGPKNLMLGTVVAHLVANGFLIVAAVGNDGPAAPPLYPASYPDVVGVTGVDAHRRVLIEAARGPQVMFASLGADIAAAGLEHGYAAVRGTSFASPIVAGLLAADIPTPGTASVQTALQALQKSAIDLGPAGRDLTYGYGLVGAEYGVDPAPFQHR